jgi:DNA-binding NarL/FixJ family response regulator
LATVLYVEDEPLVARGVVRVLRSNELETHHVTSKADAVHLLRASPPWDGFLIDVGLLEAFDGLDVLDAVVALQPHATRAVLSGRGDPGVINHAMRSGAAFISKPCGTGELGLFARNVHSSCITEEELRAHVVEVGSSARLSQTEQVVLAWLVCGRSRDSYCAVGETAPKTLESHIRATLIKVRRIGLDVDDMGDLVNALLRRARAARKG